MTDDEQAIHNLVQTWMSASRAGDLPTVLSLMADDRKGYTLTVLRKEPDGRCVLARDANLVT